MVVFQRGPPAVAAAVVEQLELEAPVFTHRGFPTPVQLLSGTRLVAPVRRVRRPLPRRRRRGSCRRCRCWEGPKSWAVGDVAGSCQVELALVPPVISRTGLDLVVGKDVGLPVQPRPVEVRVVGGSPG